MPRLHGMKVKEFLEPHERVAFESLEIRWICINSPVLSFISSKHCSLNHNGLVKLR